MPTTKSVTWVKTVLSQAGWEPTTEQGGSIGVGLAVAVAVAVAIAVAVEVAVAVGVDVGVGVGLAAPEGAWIRTVEGDPVLKYPTVTLAFCGG